MDATGRPESVDSLCMRARGARFRPVAALCAALLGLSLTGGVGTAEERKPLQTLQQKVDAIEEKLDATTLRVAQLHTDEERLSYELAITNLAIDRIERRHGELTERIEAVATDIYMGGGGDATLETVLSSDDIGEVAARMEYIEAAAEANDLVFTEQARAEQELLAKKAEVEASVQELREVEISMEAESAELTQQFAEANDAYEALEEKLEAEALAEQKAAEEAERERRLEALEESGTSSIPRGGLGDLTCPVGGVNSFIDTWGAPRSGGRSHEGTDIFAERGTPLVAMTDGTITDPGWGTLSGNWLILRGDDGNDYMYMHNQENIITSGRVKMGDQIATVGDTGNAAGTPPHVHFEFHPNAGEPVNPFPMLDAVC